MLEQTWTEERSSGSLSPRLIQALDTTQQQAITGIGNRSLLDLPLAALFCSSRCPGQAISRGLELANLWRREGRVVISGFHSPIEQECLRVLLAGRGSLIACLARSIESYRVPAAWRAALEAGRLTVISPFADKPRMTAELAGIRNRFVALLADHIEIIHAAPNGQIEALASWIKGNERG